MCEQPRLHAHGQAQEGPWALRIPPRRSLKTHEPPPTSTASGASESRTEERDISLADQACKGGGEDFVAEERAGGDPQKPERRWRGSDSTRKHHATRASACSGEVQTEIEP